jgi:hypothetical protein
VHFRPVFGSSSRAPWAATKGVQPIQAQSGSALKPGSGWQLPNHVFPQSVCIGGLAFPHYYLFPTCQSEKLSDSDVTLEVGGKLGIPEFSSTLWGIGIPAVGVAMPEASMHKNRDSVFCKDYVGSPRHFLSVKSKPVAQAVKNGSNYALGDSI